MNKSDELKNAIETYKKEVSANIILLQNVEGEIEKVNKELSSVGLPEVNVEEFIKELDEEIERKTRLLNEQLDKLNKILTDIENVNVGTN